MARTVRIPIRFDGGLRTDEEPLALGTGYCEVLTNWIPERSGALRARTDWVSFSKTGNPATRKGKGIGRYEKGAKYLVAHDNGTGYDIYRFNQSGGGASLIEAVTAARTYIMAYAEGAGIIVYCTPDFPSTRPRKYSTSASEAAAFSVAGRALAFHKERFWSGGVTANPTRLYYSNLLDVATWDLTNQYIEVGADDGEAIEDIQQVLGGLLVGKKSSLWFLSGDGPSTFSLDRLNGGGAHIGRSIAPTPVGAVIAGSNMAWRWDGGRVERVGEAIGGTYQTVSGVPVTSGYIGGKVYIADSGNSGEQMFVYDLERGIWHLEVGEANELPYLILVDEMGRELLGTPESAVTGGLLQSRDIEGGTFITRFADNDATTETFEAKTRVRVTEDASGPGTLRFLNVLLYKRNNSDSRDFVTTIYDDNGTTVLQTITEPITTTGLRRFRWTLNGPQVYEPTIDFKVVCPGTVTGTIDIIEAWFEVEQEPGR